MALFRCVFKGRLAFCWLTYRQTATSTVKSCQLIWWSVLCYAGIYSLFLYGQCLPRKHTCLTSRERSENCQAVCSFVQPKRKMQEGYNSSTDSTQIKQIAGLTNTLRQRPSGCLLSYENELSRCQQIRPLLVWLITKNVVNYVSIKMPRLS